MRTVPLLLALLACDGDPSLDTNAPDSATPDDEPLPTPTLAFSPANPDTTADVQLVIDGDGTPVITWTLDDAPADLDGAVVPADRTVRGQTWRATVILTDGTRESAPADAAFTVRNAPPTASAQLRPNQATRLHNLVASGDGADADDDDLTFTYRFRVEGTEVQAGEAAILPAGSFARGQTVQVEVIPHDGLEAGASAFAELIVANAPPEADGARVSPPHPTLNDTVTCVVDEASDPDGDPVSLTYAWTVNGAPAGAGEVLPEEELARGDVIACTATPNDGTADGAAVASRQVVVANTPPVAGVPEISPVAPRKSDTLTVSAPGSADADGDPVTFTVAWEVDGAVVAQGSTLTGAHFSKGDAVIAVVTPHDGQDAGEPATSSPVIVQNSPPSATVSISGAAHVGGSLRAQVSPSDPDADAVTTRVTWTVNGQPAGEGSTFPGTLTRGQVIVATVHPSDGEDDGTPVASAPVTVGNAPPAQPTAEITPAEPWDKDALTCEISGPSTDPDGEDVTFTVTWRKDGAETSFTGAVLPASATAEGDAWSCVATATDGSASSAPATSASVEIGGVPVYTARVIADPGSGTQFFGVDISDDGEVVWSQYTGGLENSEIYSNLRGRVTNDSDADFSPVVNDTGKLAWQGGTHPWEIFVDSARVSDPGTATFDTTPRMNEAGEVVWIAGDGVRSTTRGVITPVAASSLSIADSGEVAWRQGGGSNARVHTNLQGELGTGDHPSVNSSGEVVWIFGQGIRSNQRGNLIAQGTFPRLNDAGDVSFQNAIGSTWYQHVLWGDEILDLNLAPGGGKAYDFPINNQHAINASGAVAFIAVHQGRQKVFLATPER